MDIQTESEQTRPRRVKLQHSHRPRVCDIELCSPFRPAPIGHRALGPDHGQSVLRWPNASSIWTSTRRDFLGASLRHVPHSPAISSPVASSGSRMHRLVDVESAVILSKCLWGIAIYFRVCAKPIPGYIRASGHSGPNSGRRALLKLPKLRGARRPTEPHRL